MTNDFPKIDNQTIEGRLATVQFSELENFSPEPEQEKIQIKTLAHSEAGMRIPNQIRLAGAWLEQWGFHPGNRVKLEIKFGQIIITPISG